MTLILVVAAIATGVALVRTAAVLRRSPPGPRRDGARNVLLSLLGTALILLGVALPARPFGFLAFALAVPVVGAAGFLHRGALGERRNAALRAGETASGTVERVEALEAQLQLLGDTSWRRRLTVTAVKAFVAGSLGWTLVTMPETRDPLMFVVGLGATGLLLGDLVENGRRWVERRRLEEEIRAVLGTGRGPDPPPPDPES